MPSYQRYARYQERRTATNGQLIRWFVYIVVLVILVWAVSGCFRRGDKPTTGTENVNQSGNVNAANGNTNGNVNASANTNASAAQAATADTFDVAELCDGPISQFGRNKKAVFTFGAKGDGGNVTDVLTALQDAGAPASFFFTGTFAKNHPNVVKVVSDAGYRVYNQSDSHPDFETLTNDEALQELEQADENISSVTGQTTKPFFRPPYGSVNDAVTEIVKAAGYCPVTWTVDGLDWQSGATAETVRAQVTSHTANGMIIMLQVGSSVVPAAVQSIAEDLKQSGYEFVTLGQLLGST